MKKILAGVIIAGGISPVLGQTKLDVVVRPRFEYRDGFSSPSIDGNVGATFVQQRSRISLTSKVKGVELKLVPQDVRVWGQVPTLNANDGLNSLHEGWMKFNLDTTGKWSAKIGRQELVYDDSRILGNVDWAQQGRSHDAALISYRDNGFKLDGIIAYNQNGVSSVGNIYTLVNQTKGLQALHLNTKIKDFSVSVLALNNLFQDANQTQRLYRMTTVGTFVKFVKKESKLKADFAAYAQAGELASGTSTSGYLVSGNVGYKFGKTLLGCGGEIISGTDMDETDGKNYSFNPIYGTNHKFNGFMDYYYVGNHGGNVGLVDISLKAVRPLNKKTKAVVIAHQFNAAGKVLNGNSEEASSDLGQEIDIVIKRKINSNVKLVAGYSQYFSTASFSFARGVQNSSPLNHWGWVMVTGSISKVFSDSKSKE